MRAVLRGSKDAALALAPRQNFPSRPPQAHHHPNCLRERAALPLGPWIAITLNSISHRCVIARAGHPTAARTFRGRRQGQRVNAIAIHGPRGSAARSRKQCE